MKASEAIQEKINQVVNLLPTQVYDANNFEQFERNLKLIEKLRYEHREFLRIENDYPTKQKEQ